MKRLVVIPTRNEGKSIRKTLEQVKGEEVIVCDSSSKDATTRIARRMDVPVLNCPRGYGRGILEGMKYGVKHNYDQIVIMDSESHTFAEIVPFLDCGADVIAGHRTSEKKPWYRKAITQFGRKMIPQGANTEIIDISNGYRAYSRRFVEYILSLEGMEKVPAYTFNSIVAFYSEGWKVQQFPMTYIGGKTGLTTKELIKAWTFRRNYKMQRPQPEPEPPFEPTLEEVAFFLQLHHGNAFRRTVENRRKRG